ncbi:SulP family inorganic anion transporter [Agromyces agglutinans]|uniref:SulP family inorganic anion transporter n=1 Tax=Agromyces agglutinans TaxID=2662258 RepID=UPI0028AEC33D|nr:SulP family inorganic anion transporter [Agromyces agglutinans]
MTSGASRISPLQRLRGAATGAVGRATARVRPVFSRKTIGRDAVAGTVLGVESVPDGLAAGVLAGVNPLAGLYAYLFGMLGAACFTSSTFMAVQATGAMSLVVADTDLASRPDPDRALFTLAVLTGVIMVVAGVLKGGRLLRFVPTAVMTGFVTAVGVNIVLGQLSNFTGAEGEGGNRVIRAFDLLVHFWKFDWPTTLVGAVTLGLIVWLTRTRLGSFGLVIAVVAGSLLAFAFDAWIGWEVAVVADIADVPAGLPAPVLPNVEDVLVLLVPALSLAFVGLVQGAAVSAGIPNPDGRQSDASRDFVGQGAGNIAAGVFQGMPVGGSMSASALITAAGAKTRLSLFIASAVMAFVVLVASGVVAYVAMPSLAALLIVVGVGSINPARVQSVLKTGVVPTTIMAVTFVLTLIVPLQFAVLIGVGLGIILFVAKQSNRLAVRQIVIESDGRRREQEPVPVIGANQVIMLQPYGSLFFASAPVFEAQLPRIEATTRSSVVILRLRGIDQLGLALVGVLERYARALAEHESALRVIVTNERVVAEMAAGGLIEVIGEESVYRGTEWIGDSQRRAYADATEWVVSGR